MSEATIFITTFERDKLLQLGLESIKRHSPSNIRIVVVNDGTPGNVEEICRFYSVIHLFTGHRNKEKIHWRVPGFAINIAVKQKILGDIMFITCAEMWHVTNCIGPMINVIQNNSLALAIPEGKDDRDGEYLKHLDSDQHYKRCHPLRVELPFLMGFRVKHFLAIGGYDEDFIGQSYDDDDIVHRLQMCGCTYIRVPEAKCVHLYHNRAIPSKQAQGRLAFNKKLFLERKHIMVRNNGREWGVL